MKLFIKLITFIFFHQKRIYELLFSLLNSYIKNSLFNNPKFFILFKKKSFLYADILKNKQTNTYINKSNKINLNF